MGKIVFNVLMVGNALSIGELSKEQSTCGLVTNPDHTFIDLFLSKHVQTYWILSSVLGAVGILSDNSDHLGVWGES